MHFLFDIQFFLLFTTCLLDKEWLSLYTVASVAWCMHICTNQLRPHSRGRLVVGSLHCVFIHTIHAGSSPGLGDHTRLCKIGLPMRSTTVPWSHHELILWWSNAHCNPRIWEENGNEVVAGRRTLCFRVITCSAIYDISMELHQLREVAPASPRSSLSISLEIVRSCCISMGISGTVRRHVSRDFCIIGYFKRGSHLNCGSVRYHTSVE